MELTFQRVTWWRRQHRELCGPVPEMLAFWPEENALLIEGRRGQPLGQRLDDDPARAPEWSAGDLDRIGSELGEWLSAFAEGHAPYGADIEPLLGEHARRNSDGQLIVNARRLVEQRIQRGERAAHTLCRAGLTSAGAWSERLDLAAIVAAFSDQEPGGFVHGDIKPDNVLVDPGTWSVIDWWATPRVSWPLSDVASFAGNLRFYRKRRVTDRLWRSFSSAYYRGGCDERTRQAIDLVGTIMCLDVIAEKSRRGILGKLLASGLHGRVVHPRADGIVGVA